MLEELGGEYGPSPRGWGERVPGISKNGVNRTIPTRVGRTPPVCRTRFRTPDHPHAGGENANDKARFSASGGPSPRGWGELPPESIESQKARTIPTRVGRTSPAPRPNRESADHPHAGGENDPNRHIVHRGHGPSPRGWGEQRHPLRPALEVRTIPTRVGRTPPWPPASRRETDHPHAGGENASTLACSSSAAGPSPRGWGELARATVANAGGRTIPTRVGRTNVFAGKRTLRADHPHAGGENQ